VRNGLPVTARLNVLHLINFADVGPAAWNLTTALHHRLQLSEC